MNTIFDLTNRKYQLLTILGATASGKTAVATQAALAFNAEIISGDSRQIYRGMDLGTGKDINEYTINGVSIPYHLIDIEDAGAEYNVYRFQTDFNEAYSDIVGREKFPILCGGSGMYLESVLNNYNLIHVPKNIELRKKLQSKSLEELSNLLRSYKNTHNNSDTETKRRAIRAIEIEIFIQENQQLPANSNTINSLVVGVLFDRDTRRERISMRLQQRIDEGMINEVRKLLEMGIKPEQLIYYGLEYKYLTMHVVGELSYKDMYSQLEIAIHQFAKRQMTWFRRMEKNGTKIHWLNGEMPMDEKIYSIKQLLNKE
ncbi:MAG: tRNA (adenosine(37)-N6)-dimethylallyltransferase MiaA [Mangrovibacterium sp.]